MKCYSKTFILSLLALVPILLFGAGSSYGLAQTQPPAAGAAQEKEVTDEDVAAYNDYDTAKNEPDYQKRATKLQEWIGKYPKSDLMVHIKYEYDTLLGNLQKEEKWALLQSTAETWLKLFPDDPNKIKKTFLVATAADKLGDYKKCAECLEEIYAKQPSGLLAFDILNNYKSINNLAKIIEWSDKIFKMPEYDGDYMLRFWFVPKYSEAKNMPEAIKYCRLTLKSADAVKSPNAEQQKQLSEVRYACSYLIGSNLYDTDKYADSAKELQLAVKYKQTSAAYYLLGMCQWNLQDVDNAMVSLAAAEIIGDEEVYKNKAKEQLEKLFKSQHGGNTTGIDKKYQKAKELLGK
jgi:tetratricopeptide (TPR) repeat protein